MSKRSWIVVSLFLVFALALSACGKPKAATEAPEATCAPGEFCFGILLVGPKSDGGWSQATYEGAQYVVDHTPGSAFLYAENVFSDPNTTVTQYAERLVDRGAKAIIFNSDSMKDGVIEFSSKHPDVPVIFLSGDFAWKDGNNYQKDMLMESDLMGEMEYGKMMAGCAAALTTKTGKIGFLGPLTNDETRRLADSAYLGANYCWTKIQGNTTPLDFKVVWIGNWFYVPGSSLDPTQVADDFFNTGYDVVISGIDSTEAVTEAKKYRDNKKDVFAVQYDYINACDGAPDACLGVPYFNWGVMMLPVIQSVKDGTYQRTFVWGSPDWKDINNADTSVVGFKKSAGLSTDASTKLDGFIAELAGGLDLWTGPINYQDGTAFLADGVAATPQQIWYMPQLLEGMTGESVSK
jgi:simple sugar transport system substrate-binding protein